MSINIIAVTDISVSSLGIEGNSDSFESFLSTNGSIVAFLSNASNLVSDALSNPHDLFYYNPQNATQIEDLSFIISNATNPGFEIGSPGMSGDGRYVVFMASFQTSSVGSSSTSVFVADQNLHTVTKIADGVDPSISADGQIVVFETTSAASDIANPTLEIAIAGNDGHVLGSISANANLYSPAASADGNYVAFYGAVTQVSASDGASLQLDANQPRDAFVYDRTTNTLTLISKGLLGADANGDSGSAPAVGNSPTNFSAMSISANGQYIAFESSASNLVANDQNTDGRVDVFVYDTTAQTIERVSVAANGGDPDGSSGQALISADGRYVAYASSADNLVVGDTNSVDDIFVYDRLTHSTTRVSVAADGSQSNGASAFPQISADGTHLTFTTMATNLFPGDTNGSLDVIVDTLNQSVPPAVVNDSITELYVGYYNRAPDPAGETYWAGQLQGGMSLSAIAQSYSVQPESTNLYPFLASPNTASTAAVQAFVTSVYENLFNRAPDTAGENFWVTQLQTGASTVGGAIINIISGAQLNDLATINNKVIVGDYFDTQIFNNNVQFSASVASAALNAVTFNTTSITTAEAIVNAYVATAPHAEQAATASQTEVNVIGMPPSHDLAVAG